MVHFLDISCSFERAHGRILLDYTFAMLDLTNVESRSYNCSDLITSRYKYVQANKQQHFVCQIFLRQSVATWYDVVATQAVISWLFRR